MQRPQRNTQIPLRYRDESPPSTYRNNNQPKGPKNGSKIVDRNQIDQALTVIEAVSKSVQDTDEFSVSISTELLHFETNYVQNRVGAPRYTDLSKLNLFKFFFSDSVVETLSEETNIYVVSKL